MKKILHTLIILLFALTGTAQQDPHYNLYQFNLMMINPAYAGAKDGMSIMAGTRQQWVGTEGAPQTVCLSIHAPLMKKKLGVGLTILNDAIGPRNIIGFSGNVAYFLKLNDTYKLSFGLNAGYSRYQFRFDKVNFYERDEVPTSFYQNQNSGTFDMSAGMFLKSHDFFVGLSSSHITSPSVYDYQQTDTTTGVDRGFAYRMRAHVSLLAGYSFKLNETTIFAPTVLVKYVRGSVNVDINANFFLFRKLWLGAFYRTGYGPGALLQYHINDKMRVAYSYDTGLGRVNKLGGSHEIFFGVDFPGKQKSKVTSPRFL